MNLDQKITRRQATEEHAISKIRATTNRVSKLIAVGSIALARSILNDGIREVRSCINQLVAYVETEYDRILRTPRDEERGNFSKNIVCEMYGAESDECTLACLAIDAGDEVDNTFTLEDLQTAWDITQSPPAPIPGVDKSNLRSSIINFATTFDDPIEPFATAAYERTITNLDTGLVTLEKTKAEFGDNSSAVKFLQLILNDKNFNHAEGFNVADGTIARDDIANYVAYNTAIAVENIQNAGCDSKGIYSVECIREKYPDVEGVKSGEVELAESADDHDDVRDGNFSLADLEAIAALPPFNLTELIASF